MSRDLGLTSEQLAAAKKVERAMRAANKLGVEFWDNYGTMTAYNARKIGKPFPGEKRYNPDAIPFENKWAYQLDAPFGGSNADDPLICEVV